jgi:uncharacterized membrane protein
MIATQESISAAAPRGLAQRLARFMPAGLIAVGLIVRLIIAHAKFLNADEAMHYLLSMQPSFLETYRASLGTAHPPLLIILLHYWAMISSSEFFLRLPSVVAGTVAGWFLYAWLRQITSRDTALIALTLLLFSPALIYTSAELRQYALVLCFMSATLYLLDRAFVGSSPLLMLASALTLYLALLTHYCGLIFALSIGIYGLVRLTSTRSKPSLVFAWTAAQAGGIAIAAFLWRTHLSVIRHQSLTQDVAESYLRASLFHPGQENLLAFVAKATVRVFHFLFSQGAVSVLGMVLYLAGILLLVLGKDQKTSPGSPSSRQIGILLMLPFVVNCVVALVGTYPFGGTRHNSYLVLFAMPAIAAVLARWNPRMHWVRPVAIAVALALCNFTVTPAGSYIKARDQKKEMMDDAVQYLHASVPQRSILLTDYESGLLLSYYVCQKDITHLGAPSQFFYRSQCGDYESISLLPKLWVFRAQTFPDQMRELEGTLAQGRGLPIWLFQAGFIVDREPDFQALLSQYGCSLPRKFGNNVLICELSATRK